MSGGIFRCPHVENANSPGTLWPHPLGPRAWSINSDSQLRSLSLPLPTPPSLLPHFPCSSHLAHCTSVCIPTPTRTRTDPPHRPRRSSSPNLPRLPLSPPPPPSPSLLHSPACLLLPSSHLASGVRPSLFPLTPLLSLTTSPISAPALIAHCDPFPVCALPLSSSPAASGHTYLHPPHRCPPPPCGATHLGPMHRPLRPSIIS